MFRKHISLQRAHLINKLLQRGTLFAAIVAITAWAYYWIWKLPISSVDLVTPLSALQRQQVILDHRRTNAQILAGAALLAGLYFTWRNTRAMEDGRNTERFTRAVDQLGSDKIEQRVGAIIALERLASDSRRDHAAILELMCAFLRHRERSIDECRRRLPVGSPPHLTKTLESVRMIDDAVGWAPSAPEDVKAAAGIIRRNIFRPRAPYVLDLSNADLRRVGLDGSLLEGADLFGINGQYLGLEGADLRRADLTCADFKFANLDRADLRGATIVSARFDFADLRKADLRGALIVHVPEYPAAADPDLDVFDKESPTVNFLYADLREAILNGLDLERANLRNADLSTAVGLTYQQLQNAFGNKDTKLPEGIDRPPLWETDKG